MNNIDQQNEWIKIQEDLKKQVITENKFNWSLLDNDDNQLKYIGGIDISIDHTDDSRGAIALIVLSYPSLEIVYRNYKLVTIKEPYIAGFLAFREIPHYLNMIDQLKKEEPDLVPEVIMVDGNGILHPRGCGLASHLGILSGIPTIGVTKIFLEINQLKMTQIIKLCKEKSYQKGESISLIDKDNYVHGVAFFSSDGSKKPLYVSIGHMIDLETSLKLVDFCCRYCKMPEPLRQANLGSKAFLKGENVNRKF